MGAVEPGALECLMEVAEGDLRRSITLLQSTSLLHEKHVTADALREVAGVAPSDLCDALLRLLKDRGKTITDVVAHVEALELEGYGAQIIPQLLVSRHSGRQKGEMRSCPWDRRRAPGRW